MGDVGALESSREGGDTPTGWSKVGRGGWVVQRWYPPKREKRGKKAKKERKERRKEGRKRKKEKKEKKV